MTVQETWDIFSIIYQLYWLSACTTNYQLSKHSAYSSKHVHLCKIFQSGKNLPIEQNYSNEQVCYPI